MIQKKIKDVFRNELHLYIWDNVENPKGVIQIVHGINEHGLRYCSFAEYLNLKGYIVYLHDQLSQGKSRTEKDQDVVYFDKNGIDSLEFGVIAVYDEIVADYPDLNIYAIGHSLGAGVLRACLIDDVVSYKKVILNGTGKSSTKGMGFIIFVGGLIKLFGSKKPSNLFDGMFRETQYKLKEKVEMDHFIEWLTRDKGQNEIDKLDKYLYIRLSVSVFVDIIKLFKYVNTKRNIAKIKRDNVFLLISGTHDPATNFSIETSELNDRFVSLGIDSTLYQNFEGRHDSFQETNKLEIYEKVVEFLN